SDGTAFNWLRKRDIFAKSRLYVATPSHWLMQQVQQSMLAPAIPDSRFIPTGIDLRIFHPSDKARIRANLRVPQNTKMILFAANGIRRNMWKDYTTVRDAVSLVAASLRDQSLLFIALGERAEEEQIGRARIRF